MTLGISATGFALSRQLRDMLADLHLGPEQAIRQAGFVFIGSVGPLLLTLTVFGAASVLLQTGFLINTSALSPDLGRLDPHRGIKRLMGLDNLVEAIKALAKFAVLGWAAWAALSSLWPFLPQVVLWTPEKLSNQTTHALVHIVLLVLGAQVAIALLDAGWIRWRFVQRLRMSREDVRQESKEADGDPRTKARFRQLRQVRARRRMMAAVAKATVVVTNPTHYAVALAYDRSGLAAPRVVAKGIDEVAARIRLAAERAGVPMVANPPLARALHKMPLDAEIPAEHFQAVAEIVAYVWRLKRLSSPRS